jgi:enoyl-CoA hydratase
MQLQNLLYEVRDGVGVVTVNRPKALNALDSRTIEELGQAIEAARNEAGLRALVVTGAGDKAFVAGADIAQMSAFSTLEARRFADLGQRTLAALEALDVPTIAAVNGFALGGGCELALACDLVYASEKARFGQPEVNLGLIPGFGGTQRLARRVGPMRAMELVLTGDMVDAARAREIGLALEVVPADKLMEHVLGVARKIAGKGAVCVAQGKRAVLAARDTDLKSGGELERQAFAVLFGTEDTREGMKAFLEKRPAKFQGR